MPTTICIKVTAHGVCLLHVPTTLDLIQKILAIREIDWVFPYVLLDCTELFRGSDEVIETFFLPKSTGSPQQFINLTCAELFPRTTLLEEICVAEQTYQQMNMIGHNHKVTYMVPIAIKVQQTVRHNL